MRDGGWGGEGKKEKRPTGAITKDALPNRFGRNTEFRAV